MTDPDRIRAAERAAEKEAEWLVADAVRLEYERRPEVERRRVIDERFEALESGMDDIKKEVAENTVITTQIRDLLTSFAVMAKISKWLTVMGAFGVTMYHTWQKVTGR